MRRLRCNKKCQLRERRKRLVKSSRRGRGVVIVMAQDGCISWRWHGEHGHEKLFPPLRIVQFNSAECVYAGLETSLPDRGPYYVSDALSGSWWGTVFQGV